MSELSEIKKVYSGFWGINLHGHNRGGFRFTWIGGELKIVIGRWGATRERALSYFINELKKGLKNLHCKGGELKNGKIK